MDGDVGLSAVPSSVPTVPSKEEINRAGERLRVAWAGDQLVDEAQELRDRMLVSEFRRGFQYPMQKTAVGLRQFVERESSAPFVAQRLKRLPQIIRKLNRYPETKLARLEDIGGCRAVLADSAEVAGVMARIERNWDVRRVRDYVTRPKTSGYRGIHVIIERDAHRIEVQLRTAGQQAWAETVEQLAGRYSVPLKDEQGPEELLAWLRLAATGIALEESGVDWDETFRRRLAEARRVAFDWMRTRDRG